MLRWREPQPAQPWQGVRKADRYGNACIQVPGLSAAQGLDPGPISEDCLYLNVWTPKPDPSAKLSVKACNWRKRAQLWSTSTTVSCSWVFLSIQHWKREIPAVLPTLVCLIKLPHCNGYSKTSSSSEAIRAT